MTAKEMFEALGYVQTIKNDDLIEYTDHSHGDEGYIYVSFIRMWKEYEVGYYDVYETKRREATRVSIKEHEVGYYNVYETKRREPMRVSIEVHEAITKQMQELGWI